MNRQRTLDFPSGLVRTSDPPESHQAVREIVADGTHGRMLHVALDAVKETPGLTANELEVRHGYRDGQLRKRLTELESLGLVRRGPVRRSEITGKNNVTWIPAP